MIQLQLKRIHRYDYVMASGNGFYTILWKGVRRIGMVNGSEFTTENVEICNGNEEKEITIKEWEGME